MTQSGHLVACFQFCCDGLTDWQGTSDEATKVLGPSRRRGNHGIEQSQGAAAGPLPAEDWGTLESFRNEPRYAGTPCSVSSGLGAARLVGGKEHTARWSLCRRRH